MSTHYSVGLVCHVVLLFPRSVHYANMSMQYSAIFKNCNNENFQMKNSDIFLIFALKHGGGSNVYPQSMF